MKTALATFVLVLAAAFAAVAGQAVAAAQHGSSLKTVTVAMHDPGCHWFAVGNKFLKSLAVKGPVSLSNLDINTLKVAGPNGVQRDKVGKKITLTRGSYRITMIGQAPDDNTLELVVR
jgi:hypothetical protein